jgi:hypothetical protein
LGRTSLPRRNMSQLSAPSLSAQANRRTKAIRPMKGGAARLLPHGTPWVSPYRWRVPREALGVLRDSRSPSMIPIKAQAVTNSNPSRVHIRTAAR